MPHSTVTGGFITASPPPRPFIIPPSMGPWVIKYTLSPTPSHSLFITTPRPPLVWVLRSLGLKHSVGNRNYKAVLCLILLSVVGLIEHLHLPAPLLWVLRSLCLKRSAEEKLQSLYSSVQYKPQPPHDRSPITIKTIYFVIPYPLPRCDSKIPD